jgi:hypothetical protein
MTKPDPSDLTLGADALKRLAEVATACQQQAQLSFERALARQDENLRVYSSLTAPAVETRQRLQARPTFNGASRSALGIRCCCDRPLEDD